METDDPTTAETILSTVEPVPTIVGAVPTTFVNDWFKSVSTTLDIVHIYFEAWNPNFRYNRSRTVNLLFQMKLRLESLISILNQLRVVIGQQHNGSITDSTHHTTSTAAMIHQLTVSVKQSGFSFPDMLTKKNLRASIRLPHRRAHNQDGNEWIIPQRNSAQDRNIVTNHMNYFFTSLDQFWKVILGHEIQLNESVWLRQE